MSLPGVPRVAVIAVAYQQDDSLPDFFSSLEQQTWRNLDVCLIQNAPSRFSPPPSVAVIANAHNAGYAAAVNQGMRWGKERGCDAFLIVNADIVLDPRCVEMLVMSGGGLVQPLILLWQRPHRINAVGLCPTPLGIAYCMKYLRLRAAAGSMAHPVPAVSGAAMFLTQRTVDAVGEFDPDYFLYCEDVDYSLRARQAGIAPTVEPRAIVWHRYGLRMRWSKVVRLFHNARRIRRRFRGMLRWR